MEYFDTSDAYAIEKFCKSISEGVGERYNTCLHQQGLPARHETQANRALMAKDPDAFRKNLDWATVRMRDDVFRRHRHAHTYLKAVCDKATKPQAP